mmetsp:Transcript_112840/g.319188  ORF Transcript_112840/g.319188 Transcript_112840/m.319188 type:complete len:273 (+) Transcript_112840:241-1059(+)
MEAAEAWPAPVPPVAWKNARHWSQSKAASASRASLPRTTCRQGGPAGGGMAAAAATAAIPSARTARWGGPCAAPAAASSATTMASVVLVRDRTAAPGGAPRPASGPASTSASSRPRRQAGSSTRSPGTSLRLERRSALLPAAAAVEVTTTSRLGFSAVGSTMPHVTIASWFWSGRACRSAPLFAGDRVLGSAVAAPAPSSAQASCPAGHTRGDASPTAADLAGVTGSSSTTTTPSSCPASTARAPPALASAAGPSAVPPLELCTASLTGEST